MQDTQTPATSRRGRRAKPSNVISVDFAKGRLTPAEQEPAGLDSDLIWHSLNKFVVDQRSINGRLGAVIELLAEAAR